MHCGGSRDACQWDSQLGPGIKHAISAAQSGGRPSRQAAADLSLAGGAGGPEGRGLPHHPPCSLQQSECSASYTIMWLCQGIGWLAAEGPAIAVSMQASRHAAMICLCKAQGRQKSPHLRGVPCRERMH
jgi:hypothetical protein